jgi:hypothetical protein
VRAVVNCRVCEIAIIVITVCKCPAVSPVARGLRGRSLVSFRRVCEYAEHIRRGSVLCVMTSLRWNSGVIHESVSGTLTRLQHNPCYEGQVPLYVDLNVESADQDFRLAFPVIA